MPGAGGEFGRICPHHRFAREGRRKVSQAREDVESGEKWRTIVMQRSTRVESRACDQGQSRTSWRWGCRKRNQTVVLTSVLLAPTYDVLEFLQSLVFDYPFAVLMLVLCVVIG